MLIGIIGAFFGQITYGQFRTFRKKVKPYSKSLLPSRDPGRAGVSANQKKGQDKNGFSHAFTHVCASAFYDTIKKGISVPFSTLLRRGPLFLACFLSLFLSL